MTIPLKNFVCEPQFGDLAHERTGNGRKGVQRRHAIPDDEGCDRDPIAAEHCRECDEDAGILTLHSRSKTCGEEEK